MPAAGLDTTTANPSPNSNPCKKQERSPSNNPSGSPGSDSSATSAPSCPPQRHKFPSPNSASARSCVFKVPPPATPRTFRRSNPCKSEWSVVIFHLLSFLSCSSLLSLPSPNSHPTPLNAHTCEFTIDNTRHVN